MSRPTRFWDRCVSIDDHTRNAGGRSEAWLSDHGEGVERMLDEIDGAEGRYERCSRLAMAHCRRNAPWAAPTLRQILRNGTNRRESICELMKIRHRGTRPRSTTTEP